MATKTIWVESEIKNKYKAIKRKLAEFLNEDLNDSQIVDKLIDYTNEYLDNLALFQEALVKKFENEGDSLAKKTPKPKIEIGEEKI